MRRIEFHPSALNELDAAHKFYRSRSELAAIAFASEIIHAIRRISERPKAWTNTRDNEHRIILNKFPYSIIYRLRENDIFITAVAHQRRRPNYWRDRK